jgi:hypothetical protein
MCGLPYGASARVRRAAAARLVGVTRKRRMARRLLDVAAVLPSARLAALASLPHLADAPAILETLSPDVAKWAWVASFWPTQPDRGRAYLHLFDDLGLPVGFLKLARGADANGLARERHALQRLAGGWDELRTPRALEWGHTGETTWLLTEPLPEFGMQPDKSQMDLPSQAINRLGGETRFIPYLDLPTISWWDALQERLTSAPKGFRKLVAERAAEGIRVGACHGDFGPHNLAIANGQLWAFDWEEAVEDGPSSLDAWSFRLVQHGQMAVIQQAKQPTGRASSSFVWACAYALTHEIGGFRSLVSRWDENA